MARIDYPDPANQAPEILERLERIGSLNVTRMMSHAPDLMLAYSKMGTQLLLRGKLPHDLREAVILRIGQLCESDYEWHQHESVALAVGMKEEALAAIAEHRFDALPEDWQVALRVAEDIATKRAASEESFARARDVFTPEQLVELAMVSGYYIMTAGFLRSFDIEIEDGKPLGASMVEGRPR